MIPVERSGLSLPKFLRAHRDGTGRYLLFHDGASRARQLEEIGWEGVLVTPTLPTGDPVVRRANVVAHVGPDPHIAQLLAGHYVRLITPDEVFRKFPGPYDLIGMIDTGRDRELWKTEIIFNALPRFYLLTEDGHNEEVVKIGFDRGYDAYHVECFLVLVHR